MLNIKKNLEDEIRLYCKLNSILDVDTFANDLLNTAFVTEKYGDRPNIDLTVVNNNVEKKVEEIKENIISLPNQKEEVEKPIEIEVKHETPNNEQIKKDNLKDDYKVYDF